MAMLSGPHCCAFLAGGSFRAIGQSAIHATHESVMMQKPLDFTPKLHTQMQLAPQQSVWHQMQGADRNAASAESERLQAQGQLVLLGAHGSPAPSIHEITLTAVEWVMVVVLVVAFVIAGVEVLDKISMDDVIDWLLNLRAGTARL